MSYFNRDVIQVSLHYAFLIPFICVLLILGVQWSAIGYFVFYSVLISQFVLDAGTIDSDPNSLNCYLLAELELHLIEVVFKSIES